MWVPGDAIFLVGVSAAFFVWLETEDPEHQRRERGRLTA